MADINDKYYTHISLKEIRNFLKNHPEWDKYFNQLAKNVLDSVKYYQDKIDNGEIEIEGTKPKVYVDYFTGKPLSLVKPENIKSEIARLCLWQDFRPIHVRFNFNFGEGEHKEEFKPVLAQIKDKELTPDMYKDNIDTVEGTYQNIIVLELNDEIMNKLKDFRKDVFNSHEIDFKAKNESLPEKMSVTEALKTLKRK